MRSAPTRGRRRLPPYVELHAHSCFSFLDGASHPEDLVEGAARLGMSALALTDHGGLYGAVRFHQAARRAGIHPILGAEILLDEENGSVAAPALDRRSELRERRALREGRLPSPLALPEGPFAMDRSPHLTLLVEDGRGWARLCRLLSEAGLRGPKGRAAIPLSAFEGRTEGLVALTGCLRGPLARALAEEGFEGALERARRLRALFAPGSLYLEVQDHGLPEERPVAEALGEIGRRLALPLVATNDVHYARREGRRLHDVLCCIRHLTSLDEAGTLLRPNDAWYLAGAEDMAARFPGREDLLARTTEIAERCRFDLGSLSWVLPRFPVPEGETPFSFLHALVHEGARERYRPLHAAAARQIAHELDVIEKLDMAGYFLIVWDVARFCREKRIQAQGRGSAANSAVCYCLGITNVDPVGMDLLFERFLSQGRKEPPDIDFDIAHQRREEVIQYVYERYGRDHVAMVAEVISYHGRSAVRDVGKAFGLPLDLLDRLAKAVDHHAPGTGLEEAVAEAGLDLGDPRLGRILDCCAAMEGFPRHLGIHVGGMVITANPLVEVAPVEAATMENRSIVVWDKDDCAELGLVKIDLLGLGMLSLVGRALALVEEREGVVVDPSALDTSDPAVYDLICAADTVGVFQIESRAQMATLPRVRPRCFYDLVIEVALIRPGPIQGRMVHPYIRRRQGREAVTYPHPSLRPILERTLGVPLFQEQGMKLAVAAAGFSPDEADELRRAMSHKRSARRMETMRTRLRRGMTERGYDAATADWIYDRLASFSNYGFPESHAASFAHIVFVSAWLKVYHPAIFTCCYLNAQPMGFYGPAAILADARRHGVTVRPVSVRHSGWENRIDADGALRLGYRQIRGIGAELGARLDRARRERPFVDLADFAERTELSERLLLGLATAGVFDDFGLERRDAIWAIRHRRSLPRGSLFARLPPPDGERAPTGPMSAAEAVAADYRVLGASTKAHPMDFLRKDLRGRGVVTAAELAVHENRRRVSVAGVVTTRQRPGTAKGFCFLTLEDETALANVVVPPPVFERFRRLWAREPLLLVTGLVERQDGVTNLRAFAAEALEAPGEAMTFRSRDFH